MFRVLVSNDASHLSIIESTKTRITYTLERERERENFKKDCIVLQRVDLRRAILLREPSSRLSTNTGALV